MSSNFNRQWRRRRWLPRFDNPVFKKIFVERPIEIIINNKFPSVTEMFFNWKLILPLLFVNFSKVKFINAIIEAQ